ncbi:MAG: HNH endonuclease [Chloroflexota bacterium]|nr:HNH endonuclease [Chloroflexota bacterium]
MGLHQHHANASELWDYFVQVIDWVKATFPRYRSDMKGVAWGELYNRFGHDGLDPADLETRVAALMADDEVERKKGIYTYVLTGEEKWLNLRQFRSSEKRSAYERQKGVCPVCNETFPLEGMEADHKKPWRTGGKTTPENCQMLCIKDNRLKSGY